MTTMGIALAALLLGGVPLVFLLALPFWWLSAVRKGLRTRTWRVCSVRVSETTLLIRDGHREAALDLRTVERGRLATNGNWTQSRLVEDALTLFNGEQREIAKVPTSAEGFGELLSVLARRAIRIDVVEVDAPASLD